MTLIDEELARRLQADENLSVESQSKAEPLRTLNKRVDSFPPLPGQMKHKKSAPNNQCLHQVMTNVCHQFDDHSCRKFERSLTVNFECLVKKLYFH